jgi:hypothetical protein
MQPRRALAMFETGAIWGVVRSLQVERASVVSATAYMALNKGKVANKRADVRIFNQVSGRRLGMEVAR